MRARLMPWLLGGVMASLGACTEVDLADLNRPPPGEDGGVTPMEDVVAPVDNPPPVDTGNVTVDNPPPPPDNPPPPIDVPPPPDVPPPLDVPIVNLDIPAPPEDRGPPPVDRPMCSMACGDESDVRFCGGGTGACVGVMGCTNGCGVCSSPPTATSDNCASPTVVTAVQGRLVRTLLTTCGARDDLTTGCGRNGPDLVVGMRIQARGTVRFAFTTPQGSQLFLGYGQRNEACTNEGSRQCITALGRNSHEVTTTLDPGVYYLYLSTNNGASVVFDVEAR